MAFLENFGKKVGEAAQAAAKKCGELVEITKLNVNVNTEEDKMQKLYSQIGKAIYEEYSAGRASDVSVKESCEAIKVHEQNIKVLKDKIMEIKGSKVCINCGAEMERTQVFCSKCGTKNEIPVQEAPASEEPQATEAVCPGCGATLQAGAVFCTNCGTKI